MTVPLFETVWFEVNAPKDSAVTTDAIIITEIIAIELFRVVIFQFPRFIQSCILSINKHY